MDLPAGLEGLEGVVARLGPGGRLLGARPLTGGVSAEVLGLELLAPTGEVRRVVFRRHRTDHLKDHGPGIAAKEHGLLTALHGRGLPVPEPLLHDDGAAGLGPHLVMEWVEGSTEVVPADLPAALDQMADFLAALHALVPDALDLPPLAPLEGPIAALRPLLPASGAGERVRAALDRGALGRGAPAPEPGGAALLHGDYWPGNVLWRDGRLVAVLDWEDACLGDPLADLATSRVELRCRYGPEAAARFTDRYLATAGSPPLGVLPLWELYVSAAALASMASWGLPAEEEAQRRRATGAAFEEAAAQALG